MSGFFQGSENSGDWARDVSDRYATKKVIDRKVPIIEVTLKADRLPNLIKKLPDINIRVAKRTFQCKAIDFIVKREDNNAAIRVFHLHVTAFSVNFNEAQPVQGSEDLPG